MFKMLSSMIIWQKFPIYCQKLKNIRRLCMSSAIDKYNNNDREKILNVINNSSQDELISLGVSKKRSEQIIIWRNQNGYFQDVNQMFQISGFGLKIVEKVGNQILNPCNKNEILNQNAKVKLRSGKQFSIPSVPDSLRLDIKSCLSVYIGVSSISWSRFELGSNDLCLLTHWEFDNIIDKKLHINDLVNRCLPLIDKIPNSDCYILENPKIAQIGQPGSPPQININIQKSQLISIISYALMARRCTDDYQKLQSNFKPNVFYLKRYIHSRLFGVLVGSESVSTTEAILELMRIHYNTDDTRNVAGYADSATLDIKGKLLIPMDLRKEFQKFDGVHREFLGQSILIGLAFIRLCVLKCSNSINKLNNLNSKMEE